jgi:hypothetical protein
VKRALVEGTDLAGRDAPAFRTEINRFTRFFENLPCAAEDLHPPFRKRLRHGPEDADQIDNQSERKKLAQEAAHEESCIRQSQRNQHEYIDSRCMVRDIDPLFQRRRGRVVHRNANPPQTQDPAPQRCGHALGIQSPCPEGGQQRDQYHCDRTSGH